MARVSIVDRGVQLIVDAPLPSADLLEMATRWLASLTDAAVWTGPSSPAAPTVGSDREPPAPEPAGEAEAAPALGGDAPAPALARQVCPDCGQTFGRSDTLLEHQRRLHAAAVEPLQRACVGCGEPFLAKRKDSRYCTAACRHRATSKASYQAKKKGHGVRATIPSRPCDHCGETFQPDRATGRFCSDACRRAFFRSGGTPLRAAAKVGVADRGPKPTSAPTQHQCDTCTSRFATSADLTRHRLTHAPERPKVDRAVVDLDETRPFACDWCDRTFRYGHELAHHVKVQHTTTEVATPASRPATIATTVRAGEDRQAVADRLDRALAIAEGRAG